MPEQLKPRTLQGAVAFPTALLIRGPHAERPVRPRHVNYGIARGGWSYSRAWYGLAMALHQKHCAMVRTIFSPSPVEAAVCASLMRAQAVALDRYFMGLR
jgi:hypothetical protein